MPSRSLLLVAVLVAALSVSGVAAAQDSLNRLPPVSPAQTQPQPAPSTATGDDGLTPIQQLLIGAAGLVLLLGIGWAILSDARRRAPAGDRGVTADGSARPKATRPTPSHRTSKSHKKAKAARRARKRNR